MSVPIVGIGASAGGLNQFFELIEGIPASTGMTFVFVQHLDPRHGSHLAKILSKRAALPVALVAEPVINTGSDGDYIDRLALSLVRWRQR